MPIGVFQIPKEFENRPLGPTLFGAIYFGYRRTHLSISNSINQSNRPHLKPRQNYPFSRESLEVAWRGDERLFGKQNLPGSIEVQPSLLAKPARRHLRNMQ